jgi:hypothetical protein
VIQLKDHAIAESSRASAGLCRSFHGIPLSFTECGRRIRTAIASIDRATVAAAGDLATGHIQLSEVLTLAPGGGTEVRIFIKELEKVFALCSQCRPSG